MTDDQTLFARIVTAAAEAGVTPAELSMEALAATTGLSRSSLYRRFGSRQGIDEAMISSGIVVGERIPAEERLLRAAHDRIVERGVQSLTLESVAAAANVALPTVYGLFGNRASLMHAVFTRFSPIPQIAGRLPDRLPTDSTAFRQLVENIYGWIWDFFDAEKPLIFAVFAEVSRDPESIVMDWLRSDYLPQVASSIFPILESGMSSGVLRDGNPIVAAQSLVGPMLLHAVTRPMLEAQGLPLPAKDEVCAQLAAQFCHGAVKGCVDE